MWLDLKWMRRLVITCHKLNQLSLFSYSNSCISICLHQEPTTLRIPATVTWKSVQVRRCEQFYVEQEL